MNDSHKIFLILYVHVFVCVQMSYIIRLYHGYGYGGHSVSLRILRIDHHTCKHYSTRPESLVGLIESFPEPHAFVIPLPQGKRVKIMAQD